MISPSQEQKAIIDTINLNKHVIVNAVAGSGKTTTLLFLAKENPKKKILQITYNKQLKHEVRKKMEEHNITNVEIQTYHGLAVKFYDETCFTDDQIIKMLQTNCRIRYRPSLDIIVIDETQDMTQNYYELVYKFMQNIGFKGSLLILGDSYQGVYEFKCADARYLLLSHKLWNRTFEQLTLNTSYRLTNNIASFVNKIMIGYDRIQSAKKSEEKVYYYKANLYEIIDTLYAKIMTYINKGYTPEDFFILSPSLKNTHCKKLENILVNANIPVYFSRNDEDGMDAALIANKIVFTTFHQAKGRERKIAIIFGFDESYFDFYATDKSRLHCPPELYVAATRASEVLILLEDFKFGPLSFIKKPPCIVKKYAFVNYIDATTYKKPNTSSKSEKSDTTHKISVKEMTMYLSETTISEIVPLINLLFKSISKPTCDIQIPLTIKTKNNLIEDVSDLNGIALPAMYEARVSNSKSSLHKIIDGLNNDNNLILITKKIEMQKYAENSLERYLLMSNLYIALNENIFSKLNQIDRYDWLNTSIVTQCHSNLENQIGKNASYEHIIIQDNKNYYTYEHELYGSIYISGRIDVVDDTTLWELKCVSALTTEHLLQIIIYAWLWEKCMKKEHGNKKYKILNIRTNEILELKYNDHYVNEIIEFIFINKYDAKFKDDDNIFINNCEKIHSKHLFYSNTINFSAYLFNKK